MLEARMQCAVCRVQCGRVQPPFPCEHSRLGVRLVRAVLDPRRIGDRRFVEARRVVSKEIDFGSAAYHPFRKLTSDATCQMVEGAAML